MKQCQFCQAHFTNEDAYQIHLGVGAPAFHPCNDANEMKAKGMQQKNGLWSIDEGHLPSETPTPEEEAIYASLLTVQSVSAIVQAYTDGKIKDLETYNKLYEAAKNADVQVQKLTKLLEQKE